MLRQDQDLLSQVLEDLHQKQILSLLVEGGAATLNQFITQNLWDEIYIERAPDLLYEGVAAPQLPLHPNGKIKKYHNHDILLFAQNMGCNPDTF